MGNNSVLQAKKDLRKYARLLQCMNNVDVYSIDVVTKSAVAYLSGKLNLIALSQMLGASYDPELFHAAMIKSGTTHFTCFQSGKVIITGVKHTHSLYPMLANIELFTT